MLPLLYYTVSSASVASGFGQITACWVHKSPVRPITKSQLVIVSQLSPLTRWQPAHLINERLNANMSSFSHFSSVFCSPVTCHQLLPKQPSQPKVRNPPSTLQFSRHDWCGLGTARYPTMHFTSGLKVRTSQFVLRAFAWMALKIAQQLAQLQKKGLWFKASQGQGLLLCGVCTFSRHLCRLVTLNWP